MTGSAFLPWGEIEPEKLLVTRGKDFLLIDGDPDGHHAARCRECFSLLYWTGYEGKIRVPYGSLLDAPSLKPMGCFAGIEALSTRLRGHSIREHARIRARGQQPC